MTRVDDRLAASKAALDRLSDSDRALDHDCQVRRINGEIGPDPPPIGDVVVRLPVTPAVRPDNPMAAFEQWIVTDEQVAELQETRLIWRRLIAHGHVSVWSSPANGGKTTLARLAAAELAADGWSVWYFQEDAGAGDIPALQRHAKENNYRMLTASFRGASPADQLVLLDELAHSGCDLAQFVLFFDTMKKYIDLMSKRGAREFFATMRTLTQRGATVVLLGHTNKHRTPDGQLVFEGVGDVRNDVDELIYIDATDKDSQGVRMLTMNPDKVRCMAERCSFRLDTATMHVEVMDRIVDAAALRARAAQMADDAEAIRAIRDALMDGGMKLAALAREASEMSGIRDGTIRRVIERYASQDPDDPDALWIETRMNVHNVRYFSLPVSRAKQA